MTLRAPFPYFGGKRDVIDDVWRALGRPKQYIEPFCGSAALLLGAPAPASLEVAGDLNGFIANFWRAVKHHPGEVALAADYPVSHIDLGARHRWLMEQRTRLGDSLQDATWPGDAQIAGWWLWGQCSWIGSGWCEWSGQIPHVGNAGRGVQAAGQIPHVGNAGRGVQAAGQIPHVGNAGRGVQAAGQIPHVGNAGMLTSSGRAAWTWLHMLAERLERVRLIHGEWDRCLNSHHGGAETAIAFDPPYKAYEKLYGAGEKLVAAAVEEWCRDNSGYRIALFGHVGDYDLPGWTQHPWTRKRLTYNGSDTTASECIWFSPSCESARQQGRLFG